MSVERDRWEAVADQLADLTVDSAVRAKVAAEIRGEIDDAAGDLLGTVHAHMFDRARLFVAEWRSAEAVLAALGMSPYPLDEFVISEAERKAIDDLRGLLTQILQAPQAPAAPVAPEPEVRWYASGGVIADLLAALQNAPNEWWTVAALAQRTGRSKSSIYNKRGIPALLGWGVAVERRAPDGHGREVRQFQLAEKLARGAR
jgi:hypothetical protein